MFCKKCGADIGDSKFCPNCGEPCGHSEPAYTNPQPNYNNDYNSMQYNRPPVADMTVGDWVVALIVSCIPLVGFICLIVWACGGGDSRKVSRKNWAIAQLILSIIIFVVVFIIFFIVGISTSNTSS